MARLRNQLRIFKKLIFFPISGIVDDIMENVVKCCRGWNDVFVKATLPDFFQPYFRLVLGLPLQASANHGRFVDTHYLANCGAGCPLDFIERNFWAWVVIMEARIVLCGGDRKGSDHKGRLYVILHIIGGRRIEGSSVSSVGATLVVAPMSIIEDGG